MKKIIAVALSTLVLTVVMAQVAQAQTIDSISPQNAIPGRTTEITVRGSEFNIGSGCLATIKPLYDEEEIVFSNLGTCVKSIESATFDIGVNSDAQLGPRTLTVRVAGIGLSREFSFNIGAIAPAERTIPTGITTAEGFFDALQVLVDWLFVLLVIISVVFIVLAGLQFITGGGDPTAVSQARTKLIWAAVGIGVALLARGLEAAIRNLIGT